MADVLDVMPTRAGILLQTQLDTVTFIIKVLVEAATD